MPSYAAYNFSAPRLPKGLKFSKKLRAVTNKAFESGGYISVVDGVSFLTFWNLGNASYDGLSCPYFLLEGDPGGE